MSLRLLGTRIVPPTLTSCLGSVSPASSSAACWVRSLLLLGGLVFSLPIANAAPLAINQGGTGNTFGLPSQYAIVPNASPGTATNLLVKYNYANTTHTAQTAAIGDTAVVGVCVAGCGSTGNATIQTGGYADCKFDNTTTVGDFVQIATSTGNDGDCTDAGRPLPLPVRLSGRS